MLPRAAARSRRTQVTSVSDDVDDLARRVINGETRKQKLGSLYSAVQRRVNEILQ